MFDEEYWYKHQQKKFMHNIDTFYFSVKLHDDFTESSEAYNVRNVRKIIKKYTACSDAVPFTEFPYQSPVLYRRGSFGTKHMCYNFRLEVPEQFDFYFASKVPESSESVFSVTSEIVIQIRSRMLWELGARIAYDKAFEFVQQFCRHFDLTIAEVKENRCDFCWHTNALADPETYFSDENLAAMQVSRFKGNMKHVVYKGKYGYELDYIALGKRGDKCFLRMYLKTKEVVEMGYKSFFFYFWFFNGLISRYDLYVLEEAYKRKNWNYVDVARLKFALDNFDLGLRRAEIQALVDSEPFNYPAITKLADELTPQITKIYNIEFQVMRKMSKSFKLVASDKNQGLSKRIYDFLDNRKMITNYLTHDTFRLVDYKQNPHKSRCDYTDFWKRLRSTKQVDVHLKNSQLKIERDYTSKLDLEIRKQKAVRSIASFSVAATRKPATTIYEDAAELLSVLNDNDIRNLHTYKHRRLLQMPDADAEHDQLIDLSRYRDIKIIDEDGVLLGSDDSGAD